jgi:hypothetical protein
VSTYSDLQAQVPAATAGHPIGVGAWRFVVEIALPLTDTSLLGTMRLGYDVLSDLEYTDVTGYVHGVEWDRGGSPGDRPQVGELRFRLNDPAGDFAPHQSIYFGPGTLVRVGVGLRDNAGRMGLYWPQFTGVVQSWEEGSAGVGAAGWIDVVAHEVMYLLGQVNTNALASPVGNDDDAGLRALRLIEAAHAKFTVETEIDFGGAGPFTLQSTDMADNRLTELYLTADSVDALLYSTKGGNLALVTRAINHVDDAATLFANRPRLSTLPQTVDDVPIVADTLTTLNDDELILSEVTLAQVGGTEVTYENDGIAGRYGFRATGRSDLLTRNVYGGADLAWLAARILARGSETYRPAALELHSEHGESVVKFLTIAEIGQLVDVVRTGRVMFLEYAIARMAHRVAPLGPDSATWTCTVELDVEHLSRWSLGYRLLAEDLTSLLDEDGTHLLAEAA